MAVTPGMAIPSHTRFSWGDSQRHRNAIGRLLLVVMLEKCSRMAFWDRRFQLEHNDPILYVHLFWFSGHPEVYVLVMLTMGLTWTFPCIRLLVALPTGQKMLTWIGAQTGVPNPDHLVSVWAGGQPASHVGRVA